MLYMSLILTQQHQKISICGICVNSSNNILVWTLLYKRGGGGGGDSIFNIHFLIFKIKEKNTARKRGVFGNRDQA